MRMAIKRHETPLHGPSLVHMLYNDTRLAWFWLPIRLYAAYVWLQAGFNKITNAAWVGDGSALKAFWQKALATDPKPVIEVGWYHDFIQYLYDTQAYTWFGKVIAYGETIVGLLLLVGAFTGLAALAGIVMNFNYVMAGTASLNGLLLLIGVGLVLAWKIAGWIGVDRWLLLNVGVPWSPGRMFRTRHYEVSRR